jgi:hypothetical protein
MLIIRDFLFFQWFSLTFHFSTRMLILSVVWIGYRRGNRIYWTLTDLWLQVIMTVSLIRTRYSSLQNTHKSSQSVVSSLVVAWQWLPTADIPLPLGSRTLLGLSYSNSSTTHSRLVILNNISTMTAQKIHFFFCCAIVAFVSLGVRAIFEIYFAVKRCLFAESLPNNGCCIFAYSAVIAYQCVYMS